MRMFYLFRQPTDPNKSQKAEVLAEGVEFGEYGHGQVALAWAPPFAGVGVYSSMTTMLEAVNFRHQGEILACWASEDAWTPQEAKREMDIQARRYKALYEKMPSFLPTLDKPKEG